MICRVFVTPPLIEWLDGMEACLYGSHSSFKLLWCANQWNAVMLVSHMFYKTILHWSLVFRNLYRTMCHVVSSEQCTAHVVMGLEFLLAPPRKIVDTHIHSLSYIALEHDWLSPCVRLPNENMIYIVYMCVGAERYDRIRWRNQITTQNEIVPSSRSLQTGCSI